MDKKLTFKQILLIVAFGVALYAVLMNIWVFATVAKYIVKIAAPLFYGGLAAIVINVLMSAIENGIRKMFKKRKPNEAVLTVVSALLSIIIIIGLITAVVLVIIPQFTSAIPAIKASFEANRDEIVGFGNKIGINSDTINKFLSNFDITTLITKATENIGNIFGTVVSATSSIMGGILTTVVCAAACIYILLGKKKLKRQTKSVLYAYLKPKVAEKIIYIAKMLNMTFKKFLSCQCLDSLILGALLLLVMKILRLPYAEIISAMTVIFALIPYFGAFISCAIGAILIALINIKSALVFVVVFIVVQQFEGNVIYPKVVGSSVGLPALWTLLAVYIGGEMFGVIGMIMFIPVVSVIYTLVSEDIRRRNEKKKETVSAE